MSESMPEMTTQSLRTVILAAGKGTRMNDPEKAKVLFEVAGRPMIDRVVELARQVGSDRVIVIVGYKADDVRRAVDVAFGTGTIRFAVQEPQLGTAHAVQQALPELEEFEGDVLLLSGDVPLLQVETISSFVRFHQQHRNDISVLTVHADDPTGYGRVVRNESGNVIKIVEHKDADDNERTITEINSGIYLFKAASLRTALPLVGNDNAQGEYYLPDAISITLDHGGRVGAWMSEDFDEIQGINTPEQLEVASRAAESTAQ